MRLQGAATYVLPGDGPWLILEECTANTHNTVHAASRTGARRCQCPRGKALLRRRKQDEYARRRTVKLARRKEQRRLKREGQMPDGPMTPAYMTLLVSVLREMPDLRSGLCRKPEGRALVDAAFEATDTPGRHARIQKAKEMCLHRCPVQQECLQWGFQVNQNLPDGGHGIYGGLMPYERRDMAKKEKAA